MSSTLNLLTPMEVAKALRVSRTKVHALLHSGELRFLRFGKQTIRVRQEDLDAFIEKNLNGQETLTR